MSNRYVIKGIVEDLKEGKHVHLVNHTRHSTRFQFLEVAATIQDEAVQQVRLTNGNESITTVSGGKLTVASTSTGRALYGISPDVVVAIESLDWRHEQYEELATFRQATGAEIILG